MKKPTYMTPSTISLTFVVARSNPTIIIFSNHVIFKIIIPVPGPIRNSTSSKVETPDWIFFVHGSLSTSSINLVKTSLCKKINMSSFNHGTKHVRDLNGI
jgi:hypothetical protein